MDVCNVNCRRDHPQTIAAGNGLSPKNDVRSGSGDGGGTKSSLALRNPETALLTYLTSRETSSLLTSNTSHPKWRYCIS